MDSRVRTDDTRGGGFTIAATTDIPERATHKKGVARYVEHLTDALRTQGVAFTESRSEADLTHLMSPEARFLPQAILSSPTVLTAHGLDVYRPGGFRAPITKPKAWLQQRILPSLARRVDTTIVPSQFFKQELAGAGFDADDIHVVPHGVAPVFRSVDAEQSGDYLLTDTPERKIVEAFAAAKQAGFDYDLVMIGHRGYSREDALEYAAERGIGDSVRHIGHVSQASLAEWYAGAAIHLKWSGYETFGLPVVEAQACGTPVIANAAGSLPEVVGEGGFIRDDVREMGDQICRLLSDENEREALSERAQEWSEEFTWDRTANKTVDVYEEVTR